MYKTIVKLYGRMSKGLKSSCRPSLSRDGIDYELEKCMSQMEAAIQLVQGWTETEFRLFAIYFYFGRISGKYILETVVAKKEKMVAKPATARCLNFLGSRELEIT